jgi:primosomal protein N' (replication factor Y)
MYLIKVIPATKIPLNSPQILTYFTAQELNIGSLVLVPLYKRKVIAAVESIEKIDGQKMSLRKAEFKLRGIAKVINIEQIISEKQLLLTKWMSEYYWCPIGAIIKLMIPAPFFSLRSSGKFTISHETRNNKFFQKLILAPDIHIIKRIAEEYDPEETAVFHSEFTDKQNYASWLKVINENAKIIISARMALFAPFQNLKEIIVEDEHNDLYKSRQTPRYHAREIAIKLAEIWDAKITFQSPTPSIEASWLAENKKINLHHLKSEVQNLTSIIDLREELKTGNFSIFSRLLQEKIKDALKKNQQIILFINRRGASTVLICRDCGYTPKCPACDVPMVYHLSPIQFICHHCGHHELPPVLCPNCLGARIKYLGTGTQKVEIEFKKLFPKAKVDRLDSDIASAVIPTPACNVLPARMTCVSVSGGRSNAGRQTGIQTNKIINDFNSKKIQVLIGTSIIFNKGLPRVPLVAMMIADTILHLPDFRSNERTFQMISQLKSLSQKEFVLQTYSPENLAVRFAAENDYQSFYKKELTARKELSYPPFSQLIKLFYQHKNAKKASDEAKILAEKLKHQINLIEQNSKLKTYKLTTILGPSPAFIPRVSGGHIWQIILKTKLADLKLRNKILQIIPPDWIIDVDPLQII